MIDRSDLLTWEGARALAQGEACNIGQLLILMAMDLRLPPVKWHAQRTWAKTAKRHTPQAGEIVYARAAWRAPWRAQLVESIQAPVVLVTSFYDPAIKPMAVEEMFQPGSPIRHWFGVQAHVTHPRLTAMPVGVEGSMVPVLQAGERRTVRDIPLYLNFRTANSYQRAEVIRPVLWQRFARQDAWVVADAWDAANPSVYVNQLGRSQFVLSPPGFAWDCYRTYEAMAMGAIPIVQRKRPVTDHLEALPCVLVDDWSEVTRERLQREWETRQVKDCRTLSMSYWRERIQETAKQIS